MALAFEQLMTWICLSLPLTGVTDPDTDGIQIQSGQWIRDPDLDPDPGGQT